MHETNDQAHLELNGGYLQLLSAVGDLKEKARERYQACLMGPFISSGTSMRRYHGAKTAEKLEDTAKDTAEVSRWTFPFE